MGPVKKLTFSQVKRQEARSRMAAARKARRSPQAAAALQHRASLVGDGAKWRITNMNQVVRPLANGILPPTAIARSWKGGKSIRFDLT